MHVGACRPTNCAAFSVRFDATFPMPPTAERRMHRVSPCPHGKTRCSRTIPVSVLGDGLPGRPTTLVRRDVGLVSQGYAFFVGPLEQPPLGLVVVFKGVLDLLGPSPCR